MRQIVVTRHGPPDVLRLREAPDPQPGRRDVRIRVRAAGVNFADLLVRVGLYPGAPTPPCVVGYEVCGIVDAVGADVTSRQPGDRVIAFTDFGGYSEAVVVDEGLTLPVPGGLSDVEGASVPVNYGTAAVALYRLGNLQAGETVLIHSAGGGTGIAAMQLARSRGATVIGTASPAKHDAVLALGASHVFGYKDAAEGVRTVTANRGVDVVLDPFGGRSLRQSYDLLAPLGRVVFFGAFDALPGTRRNPWSIARSFLQTPTFRPLSLLHDNRGVLGLHMGRLFGEVPRLRPMLQAVLAGIEAGELRPVVARAFPFDRAADAHHYLHQRANIGKVVLTI